MTFSFHFLRAGERVRFPLRVAFAAFAAFATFATLRVDFAISNSVKGIVWMFYMNYAPSLEISAMFQTTVVTSLFQNLLYESGPGVKEDIIASFLPFHTEIGVGEDFLRQLLEDLGNGEIGSVRNFAGHLARSPMAFYSVWRVIYGIS